MRVDAVSMLACPKCRGDLSLDKGDGESGHVESGRLACTTCVRTYDIVRGIPRFVPNDEYVENFGWQWDRYRRTQIDQFSGASESEQRFRLETEWGPDDMTGQVTLDAGCG